MFDIIFKLRLMEYASWKNSKPLPGPTAKKILKYFKKFGFTSFDMPYLTQGEALSYHGIEIIVFDEGSVKVLSPVGDSTVFLESSNTIIRDTKKTIRDMMLISYAQEG